MSFENVSCSSINWYPSSVTGAVSTASTSNTASGVLTAAQVYPGAGGGIILNTYLSGCSLALPTGTALTALFPAGLQANDSFPCLFSNAGYLSGSVITLSGNATCSVAGAGRFTASDKVQFVYNGSGVWTCYT